MAHGEVQPVDGRVLGERGQGRLEVADRGRRGGDHLPRTEPDAGDTAAAAQRAGDDASREQTEATDNDGGQFAVATLLIDGVVPVASSPLRDGAHGADGG